MTKSENLKKKCIFCNIFIQIFSVTHWQIWNEFVSHTEEEQAAFLQSQQYPGDEESSDEDEDDGWTKLDNRSGTLTPEFFVCRNSCISLMKKILADFSVRFRC